MCGLKRNSEGHVGSNTKDKRTLCKGQKLYFTASKTVLIGMSYIVSEGAKYPFLKYKQTKAFGRLVGYFCFLGPNYRYKSTELGVLGKNHMWY